MQKLISIITTTYNNENFIAQCIESVLQQTYDNFEFIIINDCSTDRTLQIIQSYKKKDHRIKIINNLKNIGPAGGRNKGIKCTQGKYIAIIDADDIWCDKNKLRQQVEFMDNNPNYGVCGSSYFTVNEKGEILSKTINRIRDKEIREHFLKDSQFLHSSVLIRKNIIDKIGGYNEMFKVGQDYEFLLRIGKESKLHNLDIPMVKYRINPQGISSKKRFKQKIMSLKATWKYKNYYPNKYKSLFLKASYTVCPDFIANPVIKLIKSIYS